MDAELTYGSIKKVYKEQFQFEKSTRGWEITEKSNWPTKTVKAGMETLYSKGAFVRLDTAAALAKKEGKVLEQADALEAAFRYNEAYNIRKAYIQTAKNLTASDWFKAAKSAIESGHITAAMRCYEKAFDLDPTLPIPEGGLVMKKIRGDSEYTDDELRSMKVDTKGPDEYTPDTAGDESGENASDGGSADANPGADGDTNGQEKEAPTKEEEAKPEAAEKPAEPGTPEPSNAKPTPETP